MRVQAINFANVYHKVNLSPKIAHKVVDNPIQPQPDLSFRGKFGSIVGGVLGFAATVGAVFIAPPAAAALLSCMTGAGAIAGAVAGDAAENAVNEKDDKNK